MSHHTVADRAQKLKETLWAQLHEAQIARQQLDAATEAAERTARDLVEAMIGSEMPPGLRISRVEFSSRFQYVYRVYVSHSRDRFGEIGFFAANCTVFNNWMFNEKAAHGCHVYTSVRPFPCEMTQDALALIEDAK